MMVVVIVVMMVVVVVVVVTAVVVGSSACRAADVPRPISSASHSQSHAAQFRAVRAARRITVWSRSGSRTEFMAHSTSFFESMMEHRGRR